MMRAVPPALAFVLAMAAGLGPASAAAIAAAEALRQTGAFRR
jgi:hypothetical protein